MKISSNRLDLQYFKYKEEYEKKVVEVLRSGYYILGPEGKAFEKEFANYVGTKYAVGLANGLDSLIIALRILGIKKGDEVIVQANTYIATVMGITKNDATPVFVEPNECHNMDAKLIENAITDKTKAVLVTHLYGQATYMKDIVNVCKKHNIYLIEDCAQAHGSKSEGKMTGTFGIIGCFSFYPSKNLGAFGDAGALVTDNEELAKKAMIYRNYGSEVRYHNQVIGMNSRLDEIQAGLLRVKLKHLTELENERAVIANNYLAKITNPLIELPIVAKDCTHVWHLFVIRCKYRDQLIAHLKKAEIETLIHYPIPPHMAEGYAYLGHHEGDFPFSEQLAQEVLTIPLYNGMTVEEQDYVINNLNTFKI